MQPLRTNPQLSNREHARRAGASPSTVQPVRKKLEKVSKLDTFEKRVDPRTGNATQPASRPRPELSPEPAPSNEAAPLAPGFGPGDLDSREGFWRVFGDSRGPLRIILVTGRIRISWCTPGKIRPPNQPDRPKPTPSHQRPQAATQAPEIPSPGQIPQPVHTLSPYAFRGLEP